MTPSITKYYYIIKLENSGIRGLPLEWFKDYLTNRKQFVTISNISFSIYPVMCGVPQGSVLGPLFFLVYINDLPRSLTVLKSILFADDCSAHASSPDIHRLVRDVNDYLYSLSE